MGEVAAMRTEGRNARISINSAQTAKKGSMIMQLSEHFHLSEFTKSQHGQKKWPPVFRFGHVANKQLLDVADFGFFGE